jgi:hypothetical protein
MAAKPRTKTKRAPVKPLFSGKSHLAEAGKLTRFQPGVCPNPGGRPSVAALSSAYRHKLAEPLNLKISRALGLSDGATVAQGIAHIMANAALSGDVAAAREITNRTEGQAPQFLALATNAQPKTEVTIRVVEDAPLPKPEGTSELFDGLLNLVRTSHNPELMTAAANLARLLRKHGNKRTA